MSNLKTIIRSKQYKEELEKLQNSGTSSHQRRYNALLEEETKLSLNPLIPEYKLHGVGTIMAAKPMGQIRLYYEIIEDFIYLMWVNNDKCLHDTNNGVDRDPCHNEFLSLYSNGKIDSFQKPIPKAEVIFTMRGTWLTDLNFTAELKQGSSHSQAILNFQQNSNNEYSIISLSVTNYDSEFLSELLLKTAESAKEYGITLCYELMLGMTTEEVRCQKQALSKANFSLVDSSPDLEVWTFPKI